MTALETIQAALPLNQYPPTYGDVAYGTACFLGFTVLSSIGILILFCYLEKLGKPSKIKERTYHIIKCVAIAAAFLLCSEFGKSKTTSHRIDKWTKTTEDFAKVLEGKVVIQSLEANIANSQIITLRGYEVLGQFQGKPIQRPVKPFTARRDTLDTLNQRVFQPQGLALMSPP